jgi:serine/threonine protein kinase
MDIERDGEASLDSFVTASCDWTEVREARQFLDSAEYHKPCKIIDSSMLTIGEKIGEGGQATIFEGLWHNGAGVAVPGNGAIKVAVKKFRTHIERWPDEILKLKGGNLCRLHGYVNLDNGDSATLLVMDRYECDLRFLIDRNKTAIGNNAGTSHVKPFSATTILSLIAQIALGMRCLHAHGIIHRDLKAANILVVDSASTKVDIVIADFEISSTAVGTRFWRAPEILRVLQTKPETPSLAQDIKISEAFSFKSDVYGFGMTCYELLTGQSPLADLRACDYEAVLSGRRPELPRDLNPKLRALIHSCWHATPQKRPTFCEIILELRHVVAEMALPPIQELVSCSELFPAKLASPATVSLFVETLRQYVKHYGWQFFVSYHSLPPEEAVQVLKLLDHIEDRRCEIWRALPDDTILRERCRNIKSIFVVHASTVGDFELGDEYFSYVRELHSRWVSDQMLNL